MIFEEDFLYGFVGHDGEIYGRGCEEGAGCCDSFAVAGVHLLEAYANWVSGVVVGIADVAVVERGVERAEFWIPGVWEFDVDGPLKIQSALLRVVVKGWDIYP